MSRYESNDVQGVTGDILQDHYEEWKAKDEQMERAYHEERTAFSSLIHRLLGQHNEPFSFKDYQAHILSGLRQGILDGAGDIEGAINAVEKIAVASPTRFKPPLHHSRLLNFLSSMLPNSMLEADQRKDDKWRRKLAFDFVSGKVGV